MAIHDIANFPECGKSTYRLELDVPGCGMLQESKQRIDTADQMLKHQRLLHRDIPVYDFPAELIQLMHGVMEVPYRPVPRIVPTGLNDPAYELNTMTCGLNIEFIRMDLLM